MFNEIIGMYLADKYGIIADRLLFTQSIDANDTTSFTISDATNGVKLKNDLSTYDYILTKYSIWSQNGILDVTIKPDNESTNQLKTYAFTQKTEAPIIPVKHIQADLFIEATNSQNIEDDLFLAIEFFKIPQNKLPELIDIGESFFTSLENIDIQTLGIEKYLIYTNELLKALIIANGGEIPSFPEEAGIIPDVRYDIDSPPIQSEPSRKCRR